MSVAAVVALVLVAGVLGAGAMCALRSRKVTRRRYAFAESLHELRGSLAAIQLGTSALEVRGKNDEDGRGRVDALRTQIERATAAVEDLDAHLSGMRTSSPEPNHELVELGEIVRRRTAAWDRLAFAKGGVVELHWPLGPALVHADPRRVCQALDNLISNGLDHGGGLVTLSGSFENGVVRISVSDCGPGIGRPLEDVPRAAWDSPHGHGLAVVRRAVELHRGRLRAISRPDGTDVEIELPLAARLDLPTSRSPASPVPEGVAASLSGAP
jgi:signal transduction histidine kinase